MADTPADFVKKIVTLLKDASVRQKMGEKARAFVLAHHTWKRNADDFEALYRDAISRSSAQKAAPARG